MKRAHVFSAAALLVAGGIIAAFTVLPRAVFAPTEPTGEVGRQAADFLPLASNAPAARTVAPTAPPLAAIETIADNLTIPWGLAWLPGGELLVTERPGRLLLIGSDRTVIPINGVAHVGEGGLLGVTVHPGFAENRWVYLYLTSRAGGGLVNRVERYELQGSELTNKVVIIDNIPGAQNHDGGQIAFSPDGFLYITTGDASQERLAQDTTSLAGKILRLHDDGRIPAANPFKNAVYSLGHRNVQGITWDSQGRLWATEHGRSGVTSGFDEINIIQAGQNYGWPDIQGGQQRPGLRPPHLHSGATSTWAPAGAVIIEDRLFFGGLRGEALYEISLSGSPDLTTHFYRDFGRIRAVALGPDNMLYLTTSNRDGRGNPREGDDKIIRINPAAL